MRYSCHLYLRSDGELGRYPIIEVDDTGVIVAIEECGETLTERAGTQFHGGVIVTNGAKLIGTRFVHRSEFMALTKGHEVNIGERAELFVIDNFDLNTFKGDAPRVRQLTKKLHMS